MAIEIESYRLQIGLHFYRQAKVKGLHYLTFFELLVILSLLLIRSGDVELNPGPDPDLSLSTTGLSCSQNLTEISNNFSVVHYNIQSLINKVDILESELNDFNVICLTETWLDARTQTEDIEFNGFKTFRRDRIADSHGGLCVYVKDNLHSKRRNDLELQNIECIWVEVLVQQHKILIGTFYRPPNSTNEVLSTIENSIGLAVDTNIQNILITGDFNFDMAKPNKKILDLFQYFGLENLITEPTHYSENTSSIIDLFLTSNKSSILLSGVGEPILEQNIRYHCPIYCIFKFCKIISPVFTRKIWLYDKGDYESLSQEILDTDWERLKNDNIDIYANNITECILELSKKYIPNKTIKIRQSDPPWLNNTIKKLMRKRKRYFDRYKRTRLTNDFDKYKQLRNRVTSEIRKSKKAQTEKLADKLASNSSESRDWWKTLKSFIKPSKSSSLPPLVKDGEVFQKEKDKANLLNDFFTQQTFLDETNASLPHLNSQIETSLDTITITPSEVEDILKSLKTGKATGPDNINNRILKEVAYPLSFPLCELYNLSLTKGTVPSVWKQANVTPVFKKDDPADVSNYRPISLLSTLGKAFEKIIHKYVFNYFFEHQILTTLQSGFVPGDSTVNQLVDIYNTFCKALDDGKEVRCVFFDISKAFDRVWHKGLLFKLRNLGISGSLLEWFTDYLNNRTQRVVLPGVSSPWTTLKAGVPQGSILGPLLFLVYINDIVQDINSTIRLFADDTSLYIIVENPAIAAQILNSDIAKVYAWASKWLVTFNPDKSEALLVSRKYNKLNHPPVHMDYQFISETDSHKHLGLILSNNCTWHEHFEYIKSKAWKRVNVMRKLKSQLDRKSLQTIYFSFIRPLLEYGDVVWCNCTLYESNELEKIHNEAARIVTGATKLVSLNSLFRETGWESLSARRRKHKLTLFYKMKNNLCPDYLCSLVSPSTGSMTTYNLRNAENLQTVHSNTQQYYRSFLPSVIREWNNLPLNIRNSSNLSSFKKNLNTDIITIPKYYYTGNRMAQILHTRLRTNCSSLNLDLFHKNITDSPLCNCGSIEDAQHFFFHCRYYTAQRQELLTAISVYQTPNLDILLYGDTSLPNEANEKIFESVHKYIFKTKRF